MSQLVKAAFAASIVFAAACQPVADAPQATEVAPEPAAETGGLPIAHILKGTLTPGAGDEGVSIVGIEPLLAAPTYQNQPTFAPADQSRFYYVAGNENAKTDLWSYDLASGEKTQITDTPMQSEFSPKPTPDGGVSFIQESEDAEMTRVHALQNPGDVGAAVIQTGPVGYYEWLQGGATLAVFYRSEPPMLQFVDVASSDARNAFENVGRVLLSSPDGTTLFAARGNEAEQYEIVAVDVDSGATEPLLDLPPGAQDFFLVFDEFGLPAMAYSSMGTQVVTYDFANDSIWRSAADISDLGYGSITRVSVGAADEGGERPILFVAHRTEE